MIPVFAPKFGLAGVIAGLFANGEQGVWYDPSDMSTMFQDAAGTTPVTGMEQPVGRILDKSGRGNHATQTTTAMRPVLQARYNLLTNTETLSTQTVTVMATTQRLRFEGSGTITLSGAATGTYSAGSHTFSTTAGSLTLTVSGTVTKADLRAANDGIGLPAYQRVGAATSGSGSTAGNADYDTAGFPPYLRFFGVETWLVTPSINFTGTDKMTVFSGLRNLQLGNNQILAELSTNAATNNGSFSVWAPIPFLNASYAYVSKGTIDTVASAAANLYPAPTSNVLTGQGDIAGDLARLRINGSQISQNTGDQGAGNYGNYQLFIGRRGGTANSFNGRLYSLIVRGAQSTAQQIASAEAWVNGKTGAY